MIAYKNSTVLAFILWSRLYLGLIFFPIEIFVCFRVFVIKKTTLSPEIKLATSVGLSKEQEFQKNIYFCLTEYANNKLWKILKEMGIPDHLTCLLRNLYAGQEATV